MTPVFLSDSVWLHFGTSSATTGAATNADSTPTVVVAEDGTDLGYAPTVTNVATGLYKVEIAATAANGFEAGRRYSCYAVATVGAVTGRDGIGEFEVLAVDLNTGVASVTGAVGSVTGLTAANLDVAVSTRMASYTQPTGFLAATFPATIASTTNITAGTITTATNVTTVNGLAADVITAASLAADAGTEIGTAVWATAARTLTAATNITSTGGTTVPQTGDSFARIGVAGAGLTNIDLPDQTMNITGNITGNLSGSVGSVTGLTAANLDVAVSTRMASYTQPTGFLAATFPLTVASTTNITAGTITTVSGNVTGSVGSVTGAVGSVTGNVGGNVTGSVGSVVGAVGSVTATVSLSAAERNSISDALLARNVAGGSSAGRLVSEALYVLRNKTAISAGTLTVYQVDDATPAFTAAVTTAAGNPVTAIDPA